MFIFMSNYLILTSLPPSSAMRLPQRFFSCPPPCPLSPFLLLQKIQWCQFKFWKRKYEIWANRLWNVCLQIAKVKLPSRFELHKLSKQANAADELGPALIVHQVSPFNRSDITNLFATDEWFTTKKLNRRKR